MLIPRCGGSGPNDNDKNVNDAKANGSQNNFCAQSIFKSEDWAQTIMIKVTTIKEKRPRLREYKERNIQLLFGVDFHSTRT